MPADDVSVDNLHADMHRLNLSVKRPPVRYLVLLVSSNVTTIAFAIDFAEAWWNVY